jgi:hypothetical protein
MTMPTLRLYGGSYRVADFKETAALPIAQLVSNTQLRWTLASGEPE